MLFALLVGCDASFDPSIMEMPSAARDAAALEATIRDGSPGAHILRLTGGEATEARVRAAIDAIGNRIDVGDTYFFTFSGHGRTDGRVMLADSLATVTDAGIALDEVSAPWWRHDGIQGLILLDTCFAQGGFRTGLARP